MSNNKTSFPFYVHPMDHKRSVQIIKETKAEIKKMESYRPLTPFEKKRYPFKTVNVLIFHVC